MHHTACFFSVWIILGFATGIVRGGAISYTVNFDDPNGLLDGYREQIESHIVAAGNRWNDVLAGSSEISVQVVASEAVPRATGRSIASSYAGTLGQALLLEQGMAAELRSGTDPNGPAPDVEFTLNPTYVSQELWFDPDPEARIAPVPANRTDAVTVLLHEFGHAIGFNGWMDGTSGGLPEGFLSTFDQWIVDQGDFFSFSGPHAQAIYGGPLPITSGNANHLGNREPMAGAHLVPDLMNGVAFNRGRRYDISPLDLAILLDVGVATEFPANSADVSLDGAVDASDAGILFGHWGTSLGSDVNWDGVVDAGDAAIMFQQWSGDAVPTATRPVPEPGLWPPSWLILGFYRLRSAVRRPPAPP